jgi:hypothetical protein
VGVRAGVCLRMKHCLSGDAVGTVEMIFSTLSSWAEGRDLLCESIPGVERPVVLAGGGKVALTNRRRRI